MASGGGGSTIVLVACAAEKLGGGGDSPSLFGSEAEAEVLYRGALFRKAREYAEARGDSWHIMSARHFLLSPGDVIEPYDQTLSRMSAPERREWAARVLAQLMPLVSAGDRVVMLAGRLYREGLVGPLEAAGVTVEVPMEGLEIGEQLRWLNQNGATAVALPGTARAVIPPPDTQPSLFPQMPWG